MARFHWHNTSSDNELLHLESKQIIAQVFKQGQKDPHTGEQLWKLRMVGQDGTRIYRRRVTAKSVGMDEAKRYVAHNFDGVNWKPGTDPRELHAALLGEASK